MVILHILSSDDKYGSAQCFLELLQQELDKNWIIPIVVTPCYNNINKFCEDKNVKNYVFKYEQYLIPKHNNIFIFGIKFMYHLIKYYFFKNTAIKNISNIVKENNVEIIHTNTSVVDLGAIVGNKLKLPHIWHLREFGKEDFNFYSCRHNYIKFMNKCNSYFLAVSNIVGEKWNNKGLDKNKIKVIYDGIDSCSFKNKKEYNNKTSVIKIVMCGSFCKAKGQEYIVDAINLLDDEEKKSILLSFYGKTSGSYYEYVKQKVKRYGLQDIIKFCGYSSNIPKELLNYDIGIVCSRAEAFGRVTVEYMMAGLCPIVSDSGANIEIIKDNRCGLLYKNADVNELANMIRKILKNRKLLKTYGEASRILAMNNYDINKNSNLIINFFYDKLI